MPQSVYKVIEIIGTSPKSWEEAAKNAVELTGEHLRDLRVAEVVEQDIALSDTGQIEAFRTKLRVSFKYEQPAGKLERAGEEFGYASEQQTHS